MQAVHASARTVVAVVALAVGAEAADSAVTSIRVWSQPEVTRVIVEFAGAAKFKASKLTGPPRVFFDLESTSLRLTANPDRKFSTTQVNDRLLQRVRAAESEAGKTRVVFDLAADGVSYTTSEMANPTRLIVEFREGPQRGSSAPPPPRVSIDQMRSNAARAAATGIVPAPPVAKPESGATRLPAVPVAKGAEHSTAERTGRKSAEPPPEIAERSPSAVDAEAAERERGDTAVEPTPDRAPIAARRGARSLVRALGLKLGRVVIDPGHGGRDNGTTSPSGMHEKDLVLDVAMRLGTLLETKLGAEVFYTRTTDVFVPLEKRTEFANEKHADLFLSIHANSSPHKNVGGPETFFLNFSASPEALEVASRENASAEKSIYELNDLLKRIALNDKLSESREFASRVQTALVAARGGKARDRGVKRAPFVVLIGAAMPSVLAEIGFLSNARDEALLGKTEYRQKVAEALARGVQNYAASLSRYQVAQVKPKPAAAPSARAAAAELP